MFSSYAIRIFAALAFGIVVGGGTTYLLLDELAHRDGHHLHDKNSSHDYGLGEEGFHVHADFLIVVQGTEIDLSDDQYMSTAKRILHPGVHLHDNNDSIIHFHAPGISLVAFLNSISITLDESCFSIGETKYCNTATEKLLLYVNDIDRTTDIATYIPADNDRVLLYYGERDQATIEPWLSRVTDRACIYTGTCPERGTAPAEECGLTCEL